MRNRLRLLMLGALTLGLFLIVKPQAQALPSDITPSSVFTGRFIPAFIGAAYDPTEAYAALSGLPVYVVAFDDWAGPAKQGSNSWIIGDYAVRTQIRADGTFQAQGLPEGANYGVYFPFVLDRTKTDMSGDGNPEAIIARTDCTNGRASYNTPTGSYAITSSVDNYNPVLINGVNVNPCSTDDRARRWQFRMPFPEDKLVDSFSYAAEYLSAEGNSANAIPLTTQVRVSPTGVNPPVYEKIRFEFAFITNRKDVDVENNINTFPLVPGNTLRINVSFYNNYVSNIANSSIELWALRVTAADQYQQYIGGSNIYKVVNYPVIRGRAILTAQQNNYNPAYTFQSYAPPGDYIVIAWTRESSSPSYMDWNGITDLNSHVIAISQDAVGLFMETGHNDVSLYADWRDKLTWADTIDLDYNNNYIWGTVSDEVGNLLTSLNKGTSVDVYLNAKSYLGCNPDTELVSVSPATPLTTDHAVPNTFVRPFHTTEGINDDAFALRGIYMIKSARQDSATCTRNLPHTDSIDVYLDTNQETLASFTREIGNSGTVHSLQGPKRIDLVARKSDFATARGITITGGYDSGIFLWVQVPSDAGSGYYPLGNADVTIHSVSGEHFAAERKVFHTDSLGQLHIPATQLIPEVAAEYEDLTLIINVRKGLYTYYYTLGPSTADDEGAHSGQIPESEYWWNRLASDGADTVPNSALGTICSKGAPDETQCDGPVTLQLSDQTQGVLPRYNLAILNNLASALKLNANAADRNSVYLEILGYSNLKVKGEVNPVITRLTDRPTPCTTSLVDDPNACSIYSNTDLAVATLDLSSVKGFDGGFVIKLPQYTTLTQKEQCERNIINRFRGICKDYPDTIVDKETYQVELKIETEDQGILHGIQTFSINNLGQVIDTQPIPINIAYDCDSIADKYVKEHSSGVKVVNLVVDATAFIGKMGCSVGVKFGDTSGKILGLIQEYGLQTRALTQDQPVVRIYELSRNLANVMFIVIFVLMAIMTILRIQPEQWHPRVLIPKLALALFLANMSLPIAQAILDFNNFLSNTIMTFAASVISSTINTQGAGVGLGLAAGFGAGIMAVLGSIFVNMAMGMVGFLVGTGGFGVIPILAFVAGALVTILLQVLALLLLFLTRYAVIWICVAVGPWAFVASVTPLFPGLSDKWMKTLTGVAFMQTVVAGVLAIGILIMTIGIQDNSIFAQFGSFIVGFVILGLALKIPGQTMSGFGISVPTLTEESSAKFKEDALKSYETRQKKLGAFEKEYKLTHAGKGPGLLAQGGYRMRAGLKGVAKAIPGGVGQMIAEQEQRRREDLKYPLGEKARYAGGLEQQDIMWRANTKRISDWGQIQFGQKDPILHAFQSPKANYVIKDGNGVALRHPVSNAPATLKSLKEEGRFGGDQLANFMDNLNVLATTGDTNHNKFDPQKFGQQARADLGYQAAVKMAS